MTDAQTAQERQQDGLWGVGEVARRDLIAKEQRNQLHRQLIAGFLPSKTLLENCGNAVILRF